MCVVLLALITGCATGGQPGTTWVESEVSFSAGGLSIHGTYRHRPGHTDPAALLISESGRTDRNGDNAVAGRVGNMRQLAEVLSGLGVATLRYDKVGTGATGLGPYAGRPQDVGSAVYTDGARAAIRYLAGQPGTDVSRLSVYALGEGTVHAMALATDDSPGAPDIYGLGLLQPLAGRYLDLITGRVRHDTAAAVRDGSKTQQQADNVVAAWSAAVTRARSAATVAPEPLPDGLSALLNPGNVKAVVEADRIDPVAEAARVPPDTAVLVTCSDSDSQADCDAVGALTDALAHTRLSVLHLKGVNHVLRDDPTDNVANYAGTDPLSAQLTDALGQFVAR